MSSEPSRFSVYSATDHSAWLWIVTIFCIIFTTGLLSFRLKDRINTYFFDDLFVSLTFVFLAIYSSLIMAALHFGLGTVPNSDNEPSILQASRLVFVARVIFWLVLGLSKCAIFLTVRRMVVIRRQNWLCNAGVYLVGIWTFSAMIVVNVDCEPGRVLWNSSYDQCPGLEVRLVVFIAIDVVTELYLFVVACYFFRDLHMRLRKKLQVLSGFGFRLGNIPLSIVYLLLYMSFIRHGVPSIGYIPLSIVQGFYVTYSLFSAIATSLARFAKEFHTHGGSIFEMTGSRDRRHRVSSLWSSSRNSDSKGSGRKVDSSRTSGHEGLVRNASTNHNAHVSSNREDSGVRSVASNADTDGSRNGIMREQAFTVEIDDANLYREHKASNQTKF